MGFRQAAVLASVCFLFGTLFVCFSVDHKLLWGKLTEEAIEDGFFFYTTFYNAPRAIKMLLHSVVAIGVLGLIAKLHKWDESAVLFDGSSLAAFILAIAVYLASEIPALRTVVDPVPGVDTRGDRIEAIRIVGASNTIIIALLGIVLAFQAGEEYTRRYEAKELAKFEASKKDAAKPTDPVEKKDQ